MNPTTTPSPLLHLPLEIRRQIYAHLLTPRPSPTAFQLTFPRPILLTNRQLHAEASEILYSHNTFSLEMEPTSPPLQNSLRHLAASRYFPLVRHYTLNITITNEPHWSGNATVAATHSESGERERLQLCLRNHCERLAAAPRLRRLDLHVTGVSYDENLEWHLTALEPLRLLAGRVGRVEIVCSRTGSGFRFGFLTYRPKEGERAVAGEMQALLETWRVEMKALLEGR